MNYKYMKYKIKYLELLDSNIHSNIQTGGDKEKFKCDPTKEFKNICSKDTNGIYKSVNSCINDCEGKYINTQLIYAKLKMETDQFKNFISDLMKDKINVYIKGGTVLGLQILKLIYDKYPDSEFEKYFDEFCKLELIRDWDFVGYVSKPINDEFKNKITKLSEKHKLVSHAKTFILYQSNRAIKIDNQALFEISILDNEDYSGMEYPSTTLKSKVLKHNLKYIFMMAKCFYSNKINGKKIDLDIVKHLIKKMDFIIYPFKNGLFNVSNKTFDKGGLSEDLLKFIHKFASTHKIANSMNTEQFLISHIKEPNRILYRLIDKNIPKTEKITKFLLSNKIVSNIPTWMFNVKEVNNIINKFIEGLNEMICNIYDTNYENNNESIAKALNKVNDIFEGVKLSRIQEGVDRNEIREKGKEIIQKLFGAIYSKIPSDVLFNLPESNNVVKTLKYLHKKSILL